MNNYINVGVDVETTGLNDGVHEILELGIVVYDPITYEPTDIKFVSNFKPINPRMIDPKAIEINHINLKNLIDFAPTPAQVRRALVEWKMELYGSDSKLRPLGHNYDGFDKGFIKKWLGDIYNDIFDYHSKDSWKIAEICREVGLITIESLSLIKLGEYFNLNTSMSHSAYHDAVLSVQIYGKCIELINNSINK